MPLMIPTTLFVDGSIMWILSPALLVWMIRTVLAARGTASRNPRRLKAGLLVVKFMIVSLNKSILTVPGPTCPRWRGAPGQPPGQPGGCEDPNWHAVKL